LASFFARCSELRLLKISLNIWPRKVETKYLKRNYLERKNSIGVYQHLISGQGTLILKETKYKHGSYWQSYVDTTNQKKKYMCTYIIIVSYKTSIPSIKIRKHKCSIKICVGPSMLVNLYGEWKLR
jgi:peptide methionine sulfoxide reductase MsrB